MMSFRSLSLLSLALAGVLQSAYAASAADLFDRSAKGNLSEKGGARRLNTDMTEALRAALVKGPVHNVILFIGDGMGDSEITLARNYAEGAGGYFKGIDALPITGQYSHYSLDKASGKPNYVTDSAASATAWSTGTKSYNGAIGVDIHEKAHPSLLKLAKAAGKATGNVTTAEIQDATPAAQYANVTQRKCYSPAITQQLCPSNALKNGGKGSITEQLLDARADLTLGGGFAPFNELAQAGDWAGQSLLAQAKARGYQVVRDKAALAAVSHADHSAPLLGLFSDGHMPVGWVGPKASYHGNLKGEPVTCKANPEHKASMPALAEMTEKAISLLKGNPKGFFLQVESASIDKQNHAANPCGQIGETVALDQAVQKALAFAKADGHTLVIVTADHAHTSQIVSLDTRAPGLTQTLRTTEGGLMAVSYGTAEEGSMGHTGTQLRVAAYGPGAANVMGLTDQTDLFFTISAALGL